jgi:hypothetical protein
VRMHVSTFSWPGTSSTRRPLHLQERISGTHWIGGWVGPRVGEVETLQPTGTPTQSLRYRRKLHLLLERMGPESPVCERGTVDTRKVGVYRLQSAGRQSPEAQRRAARGQQATACQQIAGCGQATVRPVGGPTARF